MAGSTIPPCFFYRCCYYVGMGLETTPNNPNTGTESMEEIVVHLDPATGIHWWLDNDRRVMVLDENGDIERDRQQREPDSAPTHGYPKFAAGIRIAKMPAAPGEIAPPASEASTAAPVATPEHPPFSSDDERTKARENLIEKLKILDGTPIDQNRLREIINKIDSPAGAEKLSKEIELLKDVRSPLRRGPQRPPWAR